MPKRINIFLAFLALLCVSASRAGWYYSKATSGYVANTAVFDGTNDSMRNTTATGVGDAKTASVSLWIKFNGGDGVAQSIWTISSTTSTRFSVSKDAANKIELFGRNSAGTTILSQVTTTATIVAGAWHHLLVSVDMAATNHIFIDGVDAAITDTTSTDDTLDLGSNRYTFGGSAANTPAGLLDASVAEFWCDDVYIATVASFRTGSSPISLGADGSTPTGSQPVWYLKGSGDDFDLNDGTGEDFTITGALTTDTPP